MNSPASQPLRIVAVHGVGNHVPQATADQVRTNQSALWAQHLANGLQLPANRFNLEFAYYAPLLNAGPTVQGAADAEELSDPLAKELMAAWLDELGAPQPVSQGALTLPLRYAASWVAEKFSLDGRLTQLFVRLFFREVATYLRADDDQVRVAAREEVAARIAEHRPRVVIAHSLGTVVTYEALHAHPELDVELLLTLGSPLALPHAVFHRLLPRPTGPSAPLGARPAGVTRWVNIADPGDPVAIPPRLARAFTGITLDLTDSIHTSYGFHHAKNYLSCAATAATLGPYLGA
ncbi:serine peptidase [Streptomyces sp. NBC_01142]|uniref:serine peptidase n=1 Tax=Streptomyces sp. NBC_01142 TaxID=2975865 RepID=UPI00225234E6|nr:serine peptidase [Streptomyces sp. NBC_01142]MCX4826841.1 serine peptidase [Streptomyces sp. NBC_01142]